MLDFLTRRSLIATKSNPGPKLDYVVEIAGHVSTSENGQSGDVNLRYVPDRLIIEPASFARYLDGLTSVDWASLEDVAVAILNDMSNELVARWVHVTVSIAEPDDGHTGVNRHVVMLEDRQPKWDNSQLLDRLKRP